MIIIGWCAGDLDMMSLPYQWEAATEKDLADLQKTATE